MTSQRPPLNRRGHVVRWRNLVFANKRWIQLFPGAVERRRRDRKKDGDVTLKGMRCAIDWGWGEEQIVLRLRRYFRFFYYLSRPLLYFFLFSTPRLVPIQWVDPLFFLSASSLCLSFFFPFASREGVSISQSVYRFSVSFCRLIKWIKGKGWEIFGSPIKRQLATNEKKKKMY